MTIDYFLEISLATILFCIFLASAIRIYYVEILAPYISKRNYIKNKLRFSQSKEEFSYWKKKLCLAKLELIPFMRPFLHRNKR